MDPLREAGRRVARASRFDTAVTRHRPGIAGAAGGLLRLNACLAAEGRRSDRRRQRFNLLTI